MVDGQDIPFSRDDISFARFTQLKVMRAVSGNTAFTIEPSPEFFKIPQSKIGNILNKLRDREIIKLGYKPETITQTSIATQVRVLDNTFKELDKLYKINYTKTTL